MESDGQTPMDNSTPRITPDMFGQWEGQEVRLCGRVAELDGGTAIIESTNGGRISVVDSTMDQSVPFVEVVGKVLSGNTMQASRHHKLGDEFDLDVYGQFCKISTGSMRHLFVRG